MDETKEAGIRVTGVVVEHLRFDDVPAGVERPKNLRYGFRIERRPGELAAEAVLHLTISAGEGETSPFVLDVSMAGRFEQDAADANLPMDTFLRVNGPALVLPFVRELVANITVRSRYGLVLLPTLNVVALVQRLESAEKA